MPVPGIAVPRAICQYRASHTAYYTESADLSAIASRHRLCPSSIIRCNKRLAAVVLGPHKRCHQSAGGAHLSSSLERGTSFEALRTWGRLAVHVAPVRAPKRCVRPRTRMPVTANLKLTHWQARKKCTESKRASEGH
eukprot:3056100-Rhodomonas_salina.2